MPLDFPPDVPIQENLPTDGPGIKALLDGDAGWQIVSRYWDRHD